MEVDKEWNDLMHMMDEIKYENPIMEPIVDAMMTLDNFEDLAQDQMVIS